MLAFGLAALLAWAPAGAAPGKLRAVTVHPILSIPISGLHISYEHPLQGLYSLEIPVYFGYSEYTYEGAALALGAGAGIRRYLLHPGRGTYVNPQLEVLNAHIFESRDYEAYNALIIMPSLRMGYKFRWEVFTMDLGLGFGLFTSTYTDRGPGQDDSGMALVPWGNFALGVPF